MNYMLPGNTVAGGIAIGEVLVLRNENTFLEPTRPMVLIADKIYSSQISGWEKKYILGLACQANIDMTNVEKLCRDFDIPTIFGVTDLMTTVADGNQVIIDAYRGEVIINPSQALIAEYEKYQGAAIKSGGKINDAAKESVLTKDNIEVSLMANVFKPEDAARAFSYGAAGIGLLRTELIFETLQQWPSEEEQVRIYHEIIKKVPNLPVTIRTLDIGGDKQLPYTKLPVEANPLLGLRGVRFSLDREEIFKTQLKAILRAGLYGSVKLLLPMVSDISEVKRVKQIIEQVKENLTNTFMNFAADIELGIMIEVPAAAMSIDILAEAVDFFSIGSNDLVQYTMAIDHNNENVAWLYDALNPAVIRIIDQIISSAEAAGKKVSICGDMAGSKDGILILLGLGIREFSMDPVKIPEIRAFLRNVDLSTLQQEVATFIEQNSADEIRQGLNQFRKNYLSNT